MRIGIGYDIHCLVKGRKLVLGGVEIEYEYGLEGHSDADCLVHAIADALLGGAGLRDIGYYFPNTKEEIRGISSLEILREVVRLIGEKGYRVVNVDSVIIAERPKVMKYVGEMKKKIGEVLGVEEDAVGIKATTNEGNDAVGEGKAIASHAVCLLERGG